jgi:hypothetical protein
MSRGLEQTERDMNVLRFGRVLALGLTAVMAALLLWGAPAHAAEGIVGFDMTPTGTQAGGHPDVHIHMDWNDSQHENDQVVAPSVPCVCDDARVLTQQFPTGFIGNPTATPPCEIVEFSFGRCPASTQVGTVVVGIFNVGFLPLYNLTPHPDEPALTAFWVPLISAPQFISLSGRTESDYGLNAQSSPIYHPLSNHEIDLTLWGVPADPSHDEDRFIPPLVGFGFCNRTFPGGCPSVGTAANVPPIPYLEAPTECGVPLASEFDVEYYTGGLFSKTDPWPSTTGCEQLTFNPSLTAQPTTQSADSPSGVDIDLRVPQEQNPNTPAPSEIKAVTTTLAPGFSINPNAADGKVSCSDADSAIGTRHGATCPEFSKVGTAVLDSSALPEPVPGAIYIDDPKPGDRYRLILAADGYGTHIKLAGSIHPDPATGQLKVEFDELPQTPLTEFSMHFFGSERGLLATPTHCGSYPVTTEFVPWDNALPNQESVSSFAVVSGPGGGNCPATPRPFSPKLTFGSINPSAGESTPVSLEIERGDGDQFLNGVQVETPPGITASLRGLSYCPEASLARIESSGYSGAQEQAGSACPAASLVGTSTAGAGAGSRPVYLDGKVYLAGPYKGAPLSLAIVTPAVSGPYDLGNVVVRVALRVDPLTAQVTAVSDTLPRIVDGIPLRLRSIKVDLNRPGFTLNPTDCRRFDATSLMTGDEGGTATPEAPFQVTNCASMPYRPKVSMRLTGGLNRLGHPAIHTDFDAGPGQANSKSVVITLPKGELLDQSHIGTVCTKVAFAAQNCPADSRLGFATVTTPLLDHPLEGNAYLRSSSHGLPNLVLDLRGQVNVTVVGKIDSVDGSLRATFDTLPDVPVSHLHLDLAGGAKGLLQNSRGLCGRKRRFSARMTAQNNARLSIRPVIKVDCGSARHRRGRGGRH